MPSSCRSAGHSECGVVQVRLCVRACVCVVYEECRVAVGVPDDAAGTLVVGERRLREVAGRRRDLAVLAVARHRHVFVADAVHHLGDVVVRLAARVARVTLHHPLQHTASGVERLAAVGSRAFPVATAHTWNSLPEHTVSASTLQSFKRHLKTFLPSSTLVDLAVI